MRDPAIKRDPKRGSFFFVIENGVDPTTGLQTLATWIFTLTGVAIPTICAFKGAHAVAEGRHLLPYVGSAIGGSVLAFGGAYLLQHYGVS